jgi:Na+-translocating ferredoxin:NAD+ oxidoreductase RnfG subunit
MKKNILFLFFLTIFLVGFKAYNGYEKRISKEVKNTFLVADFKTEILSVSNKLIAELPLEITDSNFKKIKNQNNLIGYYYTGKAFGKVDYFDYLVIFDKELSIKKIKILAYREDRGGEIGSKRWLKQFIGKTPQNSMVYNKDIMGISGATISAKSITNQLDKLMKTIHILQINNQL